MDNNNNATVVIDLAAKSSKAKQHNPQSRNSIIPANHHKVFYKLMQNIITYSIFIGRNN